MNGHKRIITIRMIAVMIGATVLALNGACFAADFNVTSRGVAIKRYDPVACFEKGTAMRGYRALSYEWNGAQWYFSSRDNKALFMENPEKYVPQYGGYCAWSMSEGNKGIVNPEEWRIVDEKLYLFFTKGIKRKWEEDISGHIARADEKWAQFQGKTLKPKAKQKKENGAKKKKKKKK